MKRKLELYAVGAFLVSQVLLAQADEWDADGIFRRALAVAEQLWGRSIQSPVAC